MGRCIKLLAARIFTIDKLAPNAIRQVTKKCIFFDNLFQVKKNRPIIVASNIKAVDPSIAKIGPKSPPATVNRTLLRVKKSRFQTSVDDENDMAELRKVQRTSLCAR